MKKNGNKTPPSANTKPPAGRSRQRLRQDEFATGHANGKAGPPTQRNKK